MPECETKTDIQRKKDEYVITFFFLFKKSDENLSVRVMRNTEINWNGLTVASPQAIRPSESIGNIGRPLTIEVVTKKINK